MDNLVINKERIKKNLDFLAQYGLNENGGIDRAISSKADMESRKWILEKWEKELSAEIKIDAIANLWATVDGSENLKPIVLGSHHDAVPNGGIYDGALGVLLATEVVQVLIENKYKLRHPVKLVSFSAEEPNVFNISTMGSRSITGKISLKDIENSNDPIRNISLRDAIKDIGGDIDKLKDSQLKAGDMSAFIECHIEQGRILYDKGLSVGVVSKIIGIYREIITIKGEANHAGTTLMKHRHDALLAASELSLALEEIIKSIDRNDVVGTVGKLNIYPNSTNIIPEKAELIVEIRTPNEKIREQMINEFSRRIENIQNERQIELERRVILKQAEVNMDKTVMNALSKGIKKASQPNIELVSMAGHDTVHMSNIGKSGMLFVQSINGKSHCAEEKTNIEDIEIAGNVLLNAVLMLDKELN